MHRFTPENNMELQRALGADLVFCLDECTPFHVPRQYTEDATERNLPWARSARRGEDGPLEEGCDCHTCARFSRAYLAHLLRAREALSVPLLAEHNLRFTARLLERVREAISAGRLRDLRTEVLAAA